jgi:hypothetical protein
VLSLAGTLTLAVVPPLLRSIRPAHRRLLPAASLPASRRRWQTAGRSPNCPTQGGLRARLGRRRCARSILLWSHFALERLRGRGRISAFNARSPLPYGVQAGKAWCASPFRKGLSDATMMPLGTVPCLPRDAPALVLSSATFREFTFPDIG